MKKNLAAIIAAVSAAALLMAGCGAAAGNGAGSSAAADGIGALKVSAAENETEKEDMDKAGAAKRTITVMADSSSVTVPDKAQIILAVQTEGANAKETQQKNTEAVDQVIAKIRELGVPDKSIKTSGYDLWPRYDYSGNTEKLVGYQVSTSLTVTDRSVEEVGALISECVAAGVNQVNNISYSCSNYDEIYNEALTKAVEKAKEKGEVLAKAADGSLGEILSVSEGYQNTAYRYNTSYMDAKQMSGYGVAEEAAMDVAVMPGEAEITAQVTVVFELD